VNYAIAAYIAVVIIWTVYFIWLKQRLRRAREE
jgi:hypothetical protein